MTTFLLDDRRLTRMSAVGSVVIRLIEPVVITLVAVIVPFDVTLTLPLLLPDSDFNSRPSPTSLMSRFGYFCTTLANRILMSVSILI